jgi:hypothetical protein
MDDSVQIGEKSFGIKCVAEKEEKQEDWPTITAINRYPGYPQKTFQWCY